MIRFFLLFCLFIFTNAEEFYAKIEPVQKYQLKSQVSGEIDFSKTELEGKYVTDTLLIQIDDRLDKINLETYLEKLELLHNNLKLANELLENTKEISDIRKSQYDKFNALTTRSQVNKDADLFNYLSAYNTYLNTKEKIISLKTQISDIEYLVAQLEDKIANKRVDIKDLFIYKVYVKKYDVVSIGTPLVDLYDISKGKLEIYLPFELASDFESKSIYIDGEKTNYKINKVYKVADSERISSYRAEIIVDKPKFFSKLVKVEVK